MNPMPTLSSLKTLALTMSPSCTRLSFCGPPLANDSSFSAHKKAPKNKKATVVASKRVPTPKSTPAKRAPRKKPMYVVLSLSLEMALIHVIISSKATVSDTDDDAIAALKLGKDDE